MEEPAWGTDDLVVQSSDMALMNIAALAQSGALDLSPRFQRRNRWDKYRQSALIESFLMNVPVPPVYLAEEHRGRFSVIDGKQRLTAIARFLDNDYKLTGLRYLQNLEGLAFEELPPRLTSTLNMRPLRAVSVMRQTADWMKYEVFIRLNTGGQPLNSQEIRNVAFAGSLNDAIIDLSENRFLRQQLKIKSNTSPAYADMTDVEFVLRFFALSEAWRQFSGNLRLALDDFMLRHHNATESEVKNFRIRFNRAIESCEQIWGKQAFKRFDGRQWRDQMLGAMYDAQMIACDELSDQALALAIKDRRVVLERTALLFNEPGFEASVRTSTNTSSRVRMRIELMRGVLRSVAAE